MVTIEQIAEAVLQGEGIKTRSLTQDFFRENSELTHIARPNVNDTRLLTTCAALLELFALRMGQEPPGWTRDIGSLPQPVYLLKSTATMKRLRELCEKESPEPLRKRGFYAPPNYLEFA